MHLLQHFCVSALVVCLYPRETIERRPRPPQSQIAAVVQRIKKSTFTWHANVGHQIVLAQSKVWIEENVFRSDDVLKERRKFVAHCCRTGRVETLDAEHAPWRAQTGSVQKHK